MRYRGYPVGIVDRCWLLYRDLLQILNRRVCHAYMRAFHRCACRGINY